jgi:hypothetical protein
MRLSTGKTSSNEKLNKLISSGSDDGMCLRSDFRSLMKTESVKLASAFSPEQLKNSKRTFSMFSSVVIISSSKLTVIKR